MRIRQGYEAGGWLMTWRSQVTTVANPVLRLILAGPFYCTILHHSTRSNLEGGKVTVRGMHIRYTLHKNMLDVPRGPCLLRHIYLNPPHLTMQSLPILYHVRSQPIFHIFRQPALEDASPAPVLTSSTLGFMSTIIRARLTRIGQIVGQSTASLSFLPEPSALNE